MGAYCCASSVKWCQAVMTAEKVQTLNERATMLLPTFVVAIVVLIFICLDCLTEGRTDIQTDRRTD